MSGTNKNKYIVYIGTTKVAFLKTITNASGQAEVASLSARLANGFENGVVKDLVLASQTLNEAMKDIVTTEEEALIPCRVVVSNHYLKSRTFQSSLYFQDRPHALTLKDVRAAIAQT